MARTPLFDLLRRASRLAAMAERPGAPPLDELIGISREGRRARWTRREFLRTAAVAGAAAAGADLLAAAEKLSGSGSAKIVIVGAGVAGLNAAYVLKKAGLRATVYEASSRTGGRMLTARDLIAPGLTTDMGGEFIDSHHLELRDLAREFGLELIDLYDDTLSGGYFFQGRYRTEAEVIQAYAPLAAKIRKDAMALESVVNFRNQGGGRELDLVSIAEYFDRIGADGWIRRLLEGAYVAEYGRDVDDQSALNLIRLISTDTREGFSVFGESDERYKVRGGSGRVVDELARRLEGQLKLRQRLRAVRSKGKGFTLTFENANGSAREVAADLALITIPFTLLREVDVRVEMPPVKRQAIAELGYGTNAKLLLGFHTRPWRGLGYDGSIQSDEAFRGFWDHTQLQPGTAGGLTVYSGGAAGLEAGKGTAEEQAQRLIPGIGRAVPGCAEQRNGKTARFHWPSYAWTKASYSCYRPGQWTTLAGAEGMPVGNLFFAGEHCSYEFQGFMNGAAQSGRDAAEQMLAALRGKAAAAGG